MGTFSAQVDAWTRKSEARLTAVLRTSAQSLAEIATTPVKKGGNMRVDTGFLRSSLMGSTVSMPRIDPTARPAAGQVYAPQPDDYILVIARMNLGETLYLGFTAAYAGYREWNDGFVRLAAQQWPQIVRHSATAIRSRVEARR